MTDMKKGGAGGGLAQVASKVASQVYKPQIRFQNLAQTDVQSTTHNCTFAHARNKADLDDFNTLMTASSKFTDQDFTHDNDALYWGDMGEST